MPLIDAPDLIATAALINAVAQLITAWRGRSPQVPAPAPLDGPHPDAVERGRAAPCRRDRVRPRSSVCPGR